MTEWTKVAFCKNARRNPHGSSNLSMVTNIYTICRPLCINVRDSSVGLEYHTDNVEGVGSNPTLATKNLISLHGSLYFQERRFIKQLETFYKEVNTGPAEIAQLAEWMLHTHQVVGSNPTLGTASAVTISVKECCSIIGGPDNYTNDKLVESGVL